MFHEGDIPEPPIRITSWAQCSLCDKWRRLPVDLDTLDPPLDDNWTCASEPLKITCDIPEDEADADSFETDANEQG